MIRKQEIIADMHTHTIFSKHAYSTVNENIKSAKEKRLKYICITDHYYADGTIIDKKNENINITNIEHEVNLYQKDVYVFSSAEFNLFQEVFFNPSKLKWRPVGLHSFFVDYNNLTLEKLYEEYERKSELFNCFVHIERDLNRINKGKYGLEISPEIENFYDKLIQLAKRKDIFLEVNASSLLPNDWNNEGRMKCWLQKAKENNIKLSLGSDAHFCDNIGEFSNCLQILNEVQYPKDLILNCNEDMIKKILL